MTGREEDGSEMRGRKLNTREKAMERQKEAHILHRSRLKRFRRNVSHLNDFCVCVCVCVCSEDARRMRKGRREEGRLNITQASVYCGADTAFCVAGGGQTCFHLLFHQTRHFRDSVSLFPAAVSLCVWGVGVLSV